MAMREKARLVATMMAAAALLAGPVGGPLQAQVPFAYEYAVKVVCGPLSARADAPLAGGRYFTAINVHNPGARVDLRRKVAVAGRGEPGRISTFEMMRLESDQALEIDCPLITRQASADWVQGFVVIQSTRELDIVAVYTVAARDNVVTALDMERVPARPMP
jgi:hypothetical protein